MDMGKNLNLKFDTSDTELTVATVTRRPPPTPVAALSYAPILRVYTARGEIVFVELQPLPGIPGI